MIEVQNITCVNNAAFVMSFGIQIQDDDTGLDLIIAGLDTGPYPINQERVIDLTTTGINPGTALKPQVRARGGDDELGDRLVRFQPNGQTATYDVRGTTLDFSVRLITSG